MLFLFRHGGGISLRIKSALGLAGQRAEVTHALYCIGRIFRGQGTRHCRTGITAVARLGDAIDTVLLGGNITLRIVRTRLCLSGSLLRFSDLSLLFLELDLELFYFFVLGRNLARDFANALYQGVYIFGGALLLRSRLLRNNLRNPRNRRNSKSRCKCSCRKYSFRHVRTLRLRKF